MSSQSIHLVIRADGGPTIGYGHLVRTGALASELLQHGHRVTYLTTTPESVAEVCPNGCDTVTIPSREEVTGLHPHLGRADVALIDSYVADERYQASVRFAVPLVVVADDIRHPICSDLLVNGNLHAAELEYELTGPPANTCLGPEYLLLKESIRRLAARDPPWRSTVERALVTMGGSDPANVTPTVVQAFDGFNVRVEAVVGPGFSERQERKVRAAAESVSAAVSVVRDPDDLGRRMFEADFAVSTTSTTVYELMALGTPIIGWPVVENQRPIAEALQSRGLASVIGNETPERDLERAIASYVTDALLRRANRRRGRELVDGRGAARVRGEIFSLPRLNRNS